MKHFLISCFCLVSVLYGYGHVIGFPAACIFNDTSTVAIDTLREGEEKIYTEVDEYATFTGGLTSDFHILLSKEIKYPKSAKKNKIEGRVYLQFIVEKDGSITNPKIIRSPAPSLSEEVLRAFNKLSKKSPRWIPAKVKGQPVRSKIILPFNFYLENSRLRKIEETIMNDTSLQNKLFKNIQLKK